MSSAREIAADLMWKICTGEYPEGSKLPGEPALTRYYGVSKVRARNALAIVTASGMAYSKLGAGTFVESGVAPTPGIPSREDWDTAISLIREVAAHADEPGRWLSNVSKLAQKYPEW